MTRIPIIFFVAALTIAVGCASTTSKHSDPETLIAEMKAHNADPKNVDNKYVCREETPTGTNIPIVVCRTEKYMRERRVRDQLELDRLLRQSGSN